MIWQDSVLTNSYDFAPPELTITITWQGGDFSPAAAQATTPSGQMAHSVLPIVRLVAFRWKSPDHALQQQISASDENSDKRSSGCH
ncbi:MAG: hypothetical protein WAV05_03360, partial [Anaerolineales bacterium]